MKKMRTALIVIVAMVLPSVSLAYDVPTHFDLSREAAGQSLLSKDPTVLPNLGMLSLDQEFTSTEGGNAPDFTDGCQHNRRLSLVFLIACGAQFEDVPGLRSVNHFYDPVHNLPLTLPALGTLGQTSPDWALKDNNDNGNQAFSYKDARNYFYQALTLVGAQGNRDALWGKLFQSIGQVIHHVQDMAQPQHVRNDQHVDKWWSITFRNPSLYETYTKDSRKGIQSLMTQSAGGPVFTPQSPGVFRVPRDFWKDTSSPGLSAQDGLAEFTNRNFVSAGTNFAILQGQPAANAPFVLPSPGQVETVLAASVAPALTPKVSATCTAKGLDCSMTFYGTSAGLPRAAALSIFDQYLNLRPVLARGGLGNYTVDRVFTLNRFTFDAAHKTLIPKAVAYSAGLINYFFRGKMEISLPDDGVYGVVDHSVENRIDTSGFRRLKLKLKNVTPRGTDAIEPMTTTGKLWAVVKFHRNNCYQPDRSGEYGSPNIRWQDCRRQTEEVVVSDEMAAPAGINDTAQPLVFTFTAPIPINATDLFLQVVYRGPLGNESDAVAVATVDIAEPHFLSFYDTTEQYMQGIVGALQTFKALYCDPYPAVTYEDCKASQKTSTYLRFAAPTGYDPANPSVAAFNPSVTFEGITVSRYTRVAVLGNKAPLQVYALKKTQSGSNPPVLDPHVNSGSVNPVTNQLDAATNTLAAQQVVPARGIYVYPDGYNTLTSGDVPAASVPPMTPLTPMASTISF